MAVTHINFNRDTRYGQLLSAGLEQLENALAALNELKGTIALMIDGNGSLAAHFAYVQEKFGFTDNDGAKAAWDELNSLLAKLNTNASVTDVNAALVQAFNKFR